MGSTLERHFRNEYTKHLVHTIKSLYNSNSSTIRTEINHSLPYETSRGVRQDYIQSLSRMYYESRIWWMTRWNLCRRQGNLKFHTKLVCEWTEIAEMIKHVEDKSSMCGLEINTSKKKILVVDILNIQLLVFVYHMFSKF